MALVAAARQPVPLVPLAVVAARQPVLLLPLVGHEGFCYAFEHAAVWLLAGGLGSALVFAITAISPPLLLGRRVGLRCALLTSVRAVGENPVAMAGWAALILAAIALSLATAMLGFLLAVPVIGHATWHAYRDLVVTDGVPLRSE